MKFEYICPLNIGLFSNSIKKTAGLFMKEFADFIVIKLEMKNVHDRNQYVSFSIHVYLLINLTLELQFPH